MKQQQREQLALLLQDEENRLKLTGALANYLADNCQVIALIKGEDGEDGEFFDDLVHNVNGCLEMVSQNPVILEEQELIDNEVTEG